MVVCIGRLFFFSYLYALAYSLHGFFAFLFFAERSESDISFSTRAESYSGSSYYLCFVKESLKGRDFLVGEETVHALKGVSFKIYEGEFVTIMGKSAVSTSPHAAVTEY